MTPKIVRLEETFIHNLIFGQGTRKLRGMDGTSIRFEYESEVLTSAA